MISYQLVLPFDFTVSLWRLWSGIYEVQSTENPSIRSYKRKALQVGILVSDIALTYDRFLLTDNVVFRVSNTQGSQ